MFSEAIASMLVELNAKRLVEHNQPRKHSNFDNLQTADTFFLRFLDHSNIAAVFVQCLKLAVQVMHLARLSTKMYCDSTLVVFPGLRPLASKPSPGYCPIDESFPQIISDQPVHQQSR